jgi:hypothetical protein
MLDYPTNPTQSGEEPQLVLGEDLLISKAI